jgi:hypothetical protein
LPEHDVVLALTGQSLDMQAVLDAAWTHLLPAFGTDTIRVGDAAADDSLAARLADLTLPGVAGPTEHDAAPVRPADEEARVGDRHSPGTERLVSFTAAEGNDQPGLTLVELRASADAATTLTLVEGDSRLVARVEAEDWVVTDGSGDGAGADPGSVTGSVAAPVAASATRSADLLHVDLLFVETPHRLHLTLDEADATFTALWETQPLHAPALTQLRMPRD